MKKEKCRDGRKEMMERKHVVKIEEKQKRRRKIEIGKWNRMIETEEKKDKEEERRRKKIRRQEK